MAQKIVHARHFKDLTGQTFGRLTVVEYAGRDQRSWSLWKCVCSCGGVPPGLISTGALCSGNTSSCGCLQRERASAHRFKHGQTDTPEHGIWKGMKRRCLNEKNPAYKNYSGRGIRICERWLGPDGFSNFLADMGARPGPGYTLERKDNDGPYSPENCYWATRTQQARNKRNNRLLTYRGLTLCVAGWAERLGMKSQVIRDRLYWGWSVEDTLATPVDTRFSRKRRH
jgi:hypothetical protein